MPSSVVRKRVTKTPNTAIDSSKKSIKNSSKRRRNTISKTAESTDSTDANNVIGAFVALPVDAASGVRYYLFAKEHREASSMGESGGDIETSNSNDESDVDEDESDHEENAQSTSRTIFVTNVPLFWGEAHLRTFLGRYGQLASVQVGSSRGARFARVRFERSRDARALLRGTAQDGDDVPSEIDIEDEASAASTTDSNISATSTQVSESGLRAWVAEARAAKPKRAELKRRSDMFLKEFEAREQAERQMRDSNEERMDADGFTVVKYNKSAKRNKTDANPTGGVSLLPPTKSASGGRNGSGRASGGGRMSGKAYNHRKAGKDGFMYSFQVRQAREDRLEKLKLAFEQDKAKVERLKQARRFKPV